MGQRVQGFKDSDQTRRHKIFSKYHIESSQNTHGDLNRWPGNKDELVAKVRHLGGCAGMVTRGLLKHCLAVLFLFSSVIASDGTTSHATLIFM